MSWPRDAYTAIRKIILVEERIETLTSQLKELAESCKELDRRLIRMEAKFELIERLGAPKHRTLAEKSEK